MFFMIFLCFVWAFLLYQKYKHFSWFKISRVLQIFTLPYAAEPLVNFDSRSLGSLWDGVPTVFLLGFVILFCGSISFFTVVKMLIFCSKSLFGAFSSLFLWLLMAFEQWFFLECFPLFFLNATLALPFISRLPFTLRITRNLK